MENIKITLSKFKVHAVFAFRFIKMRANVGRFLSSKAGSFSSLSVFAGKREIAMTRLILPAVFFGLGIWAAGCSVPPSMIAGIPKDHPANKFYQAAQQGMLGDKVCLDNKGDPTIPIGKIQNGEGYTKSVEITPGVFYFRNDETGKIYLGVSFLQYNGFLQIPKVCAWEEKSSK